MPILRVFRWVLFLLRLRFLPGPSVVRILKIASTVMNGINRLRKGKLLRRHGC